MTIGALIAALLLFAVLDARRQARHAPAVTVPVSHTSLPASPPPLRFPPDFFAEARGVRRDAPAARPVETPPSRPGRRALSPRLDDAPDRIERPERNPRGATLILDAPAARPPEGAAQGSGTSPPGEPGSPAQRVRAGIIASPSTTVPQGALISAVLETGFDSSRPGFARALVQRDVRGFDGARVLIPRGSRLIGEYGSDARPGQRRALIGWSRLIRPDGVTIALASPATDTVGRGGIKAEVDSHFFERFADAFLQSALDLGVNLVASSARSPVVVALPDPIQGSAAGTGRSGIPPTLRVRQGTSINIFVARDLDFTDVQGLP